MMERSSASSSAPDGADDGRPRACAVFAQGLSTSHSDMEPYDRSAAEWGMVTYVFDFCGGRHGFADPYYWQVVDQASAWLRAHIQH